MSPPVGLRRRRRTEARRRFSDAALLHFQRDGFDATTVDAIVADVGLSRRTFFRYFESKEAVVVDQLDELGEAIREALDQRPADEPPFLALRRCFDLYDEMTVEERQKLKDISDLAERTPTLRAKLLHRQVEWEEGLAQILMRRKLAPTSELAATATAAAAFAAMRVSLQSARAAGERRVGPMLDEAFAPLIAASSGRTR